MKKIIRVLIISCFAMVLSIGQAFAQSNNGKNKSGQDGKPAKEMNEKVR